MNLPVLYKKTSRGKIQQWRIWVDGSTIHSESGQTDGKKVLSSDVVKEGKNIGRANETTKEQQALAEATSKHTKKLKSGYVKNIEDARTGKTDSVIIGGKLPMLAKSFYKYDTTKRTNVLSTSAKHIVFPCAVQPKLDGIRGVNDNGRLFSRTRKPIISLPHILNLLSRPEFRSIPFDGELYTHTYKDEFEKLGSLIMKQKEIDSEKAKVIQWHIYDLNTDGTFKQRYSLLKQVAPLFKDTPLVLVETKIVNSMEELDIAYDDYINLGYEGCMVRNLNGEYKSSTTRSSDLQKMKMFEDAEFRIVSIKEGTGKYANNIGSFVCAIDDDYGYRTFDVKPKGNVDYWKSVYSSESWKDQILTVRFQGYTNKNNVPRIPVGIRFRNINF